MHALTPARRRELRARAHALSPCVSIGAQGLTPAVLREIDVSLTARELIKVRAFVDDRAARQALLAEICTSVDATPVQHIGKLFVLWREAPQEPAPRAGEAESRKRARASAKSATHPTPRRRRST